jgi:hypothetical protein
LAETAKLEEAATGYTIDVVFQSQFSVEVDSEVSHYFNW